VFCTSLLAGLLPSCGSNGAASGSAVLRFTAIPNEKTTELHAKFAPVADYLSTELGMKVEYVPSVDYEASVEAFKNGDVQLAWFGGLTGVRARRAVPGAQAIAQGQVDPEYKSYFIASRESGLQPSTDFPQDLKDKKFTFGSKSSTSGRLMPEYFIRHNTSSSPADFFGSEMHFSGSHDKTAKLVEAGTFDAGAMDYKTYERMVATGSLDPERCIKIWTTPSYADYNWTAHPSLENSFGAGTLDRLQQALLSMSDPGMLEAINRPEGLIAASNQDFASIEELALEVELIR
jgi:phosphonate transport system substrate-binding protein